ncbi:hypothetical protein ABPG75_011539 [Micractinium tetrahymenae]
MGLSGALLSSRAVLLAVLLLASAAARPPPGREVGGAGAPAPAPQLPPLTGRVLVAQPLDVSEPFQLTVRTSLALVLSLVVSALSNAAGVGGGAIFVPLFNVLLLFPIKLATALSQAAIAGGALGSVAYCLGRRHPHDPASPLIDFNLALTLAPPLLLGVSCGVLLNIALPSWLITFLLIPLLGGLTWRTAQMGLRMRRAEARVRQRRLSASGMELAQHARQAARQGQQPDGKGCCCQGLPAQQSLELVACDGEGTAGELQGQQGQQQQSQRQQQKNSHALPADGSCDREAEATDGWHIAAAGETDEEEVAALRLAGASTTTLACWLSSPGLLDGVLEPGSARSSPAPKAAPHAGQRVWGRPRRQARGSSGRQLEGRSLPGCQSGLAPAQQPKQLGKTQLAAGSASACVLQASTLPQQTPPVRFPWLRVLEILLLWALFFGFQIGKEHFPRCSWQAGLIFGSQAAVALALTALFSLRRRQTGEEQPILAAGALSSSSGDDARAAPDTAADAHTRPCQSAGALPGWSCCQLAAASAVCLAGGCVAGTLGIGGGMIMGPLFLELGVYPQAASATSGLLVLFSASSAVLSFAAAGRLNLQYAAVFGTACLAAAFAGTFHISRAVRRSGRASLLVLILAGIIGVGAAVTVTLSGRHAVEELLGSGHAAPAVPFCN